MSKKVFLAERLIEQKSGPFEPDIFMVDKDERTTAELETAVEHGVKTGKVINLRDALEKNVRVRDIRSRKTQSEGSA